MKERIKKYMWVGILLITGLFVSVGISFKFYTSKAVKEKEFFERGAYEQVAIVEGVMRSGFDILGSIVAFYNASTFVDEDEFRIFTNSYLRDHRFFQFIGWAHTVKEEQVQIRLEYVEPIKEHKHLKGLVLSSVSSNAMMDYQGQDAEEVEVFSDKIIPGQKEKQISVRKPVYGRDEGFKGYIVAVIDLDILVKDALLNEQTHQLQLNIIKRPPNRGSYAQGKITYSDFPLVIGKETWTIQIYSTRPATIYDYWDIVMMLVAVGMFIFFTVNYLFNQLKKEEQIEDEVARRTIELKEKNLLLKESIEYQQRTETLLKRKALESQLIYEATSIASRADSLEESLRSCLSIICEIMSWPLGHVYIVDEKEGMLIPSQIWYYKDRTAYASFIEVTMKSRFPDKGLPGQVLAQRQPVWIEDVNKSDNFLRIKMAPDSGVKGAFAFPVIIFGKIIAVLEIFHTQPMEIREDFLLTIKTVGEQISHILENKKAQEDLKEEKGRLEIFQSVTINREMEMIELKKENNELNRQLGRVPPHDLSFLRDQKRRV